MKITQFYKLVVVFYLLIPCWVAFNYWLNSRGIGFISCPVKHITGYPCPSCGTTRGVIQLWLGNWQEALWLNPLSWIVAVGGVVLPCWLLYDFYNKTPTLYRSERAIGQMVKKYRFIGVIFGVLIVLNWIWNIQKGL